MTHSVQSRPGPQPRLLRIDFPRVHIEDKRPGVLGVDLRQAPLRPGQGIQAKVAAARDGQIHRPQTQHRAGKLPHRPGRGLDRVNRFWRIRDPVTVVVNRKNAGIEAKALFGEDFQRPEGLPGYGETRRPKATTGCPVRSCNKSRERTRSSRNCSGVRR